MTNRHKLGNSLLLIATIIILLVGSGIFLNIIPTNSPAISLSTVVSLILIGIGASLKRK